jgi:hypothetical protein
MLRRRMITFSSGLSANEGGTCGRAVRMRQRLRTNWIGLDCGMIPFNEWYWLNAERGL